MSSVSFLYIQERWLEEREEPQKSEASAVTFLKSNQPESLTDELSFKRKRKCRKISFSVGQAAAVRDSVRQRKTPVQIV